MKFPIIFFRLHDNINVNNIPNNEINSLITPLLYPTITSIISNNIIPISNIFIVIVITSTLLYSL